MKYYKTKKGRANFFSQNKGSVGLLSEVMKVKEDDLIEFLSTDEKLFKRWNTFYNKLEGNLLSHKKRMVTSMSK
jgi:hypothetical protein